MNGPHPYAVLDAVGWDVTKVDGNPADGKIRYANGDRRLRINWRPASHYDSYLASRRHIGETTKVTLLGRSAESWAYDRSDHTAIRPVEAATFVEVRGEGMNRAEYVDLLARLRKVDPVGFEARLPADVVRPHEVAATVAALLVGIETPAGFDVSAITVPPYQERYHVVAAVTGQVGCAWINEYTAAQDATDDVARQRAVDAMRTSRTWPALRAIMDDGDWSEEFWSVADDMAAGLEGSQLHGRICLYSR